MNRVFVISLDHRHDRRNALTARMRELAIPFEIFSAIDGKLLTKADLDAYDDFLMKRKILRSLSPSEIGCYLSHLAIWQHIVENNIDSATILEDDITISDDFPTILDGIVHIPFKWDLIRLSGLDPTPSLKLCQISPGYTLAVPLGKANGAQGYSISRHGAIKLIQYSQPIPGTVDTSTLDCYFEVGLLAMDVRPYPIHENRFFASSIAEDRRPIVDAYRSVKKKSRLRFAIYRFKRSMSNRINFIYQLLNFIRFKTYLSRNSAAPK
ncbi:MAG: glycosyltransferase family 25 protein [Geobacteraceae bacterium]|nr:MAG: glycosyltransferase family 25 protein [Geobacteraceae bacterium]